MKLKPSVGAPWPLLPSASPFLSTMTARPCTVPSAAVDAVGAAHRRQQVGADRAATLVAEALAAELLLGPHHRVGVLVDVVEQAVEGVGDGRR